MSRRPHACRDGGPICHQCKQARRWPWWERQAWHQEQQARTQGRWAAVALIAICIVIVVYTAIALAVS